MPPTKLTVRRPCTVRYVVWHVRKRKLGYETQQSGIDLDFVGLLFKRQDLSLQLACSS